MRLIIGMAFLVAVTSACVPPTKGGVVELRDQATVATQQEIYQKGQPIPIFDFSQTRQTVIDVLKAKTQGVTTWSVVISFGRPVWSCPSIGYPVPATTQLTNPQQLIRQRIDGNNAVEGVVSQAEPDGVFSGTTAATYVLCVRANGEVSAVYSEPDVLTFPFPVEVRDGAIVDIGKGSSFTIKTK